MKQQLTPIPSGQDLLKMSKQSAFDAGRAYQKSLEEKSYTYEDLVKVFNYAQEYTMVSRFAEDGFTFDHDLTHLPSFAKNL